MVVVAVVVGVLFAVDIGVDILRRALHVEDSCTDQGSPAVAGLVGTEVGLAVVAVVVYSPTEIAGVGLVSAVGHAGAGKRDFPEAAAVRSFAVDSPHGRAAVVVPVAGGTKEAGSSATCCTRPPEASRCSQTKHLRCRELAPKCLSKHTMKQQS